MNCQHSYDSLSVSNVVFSYGDKLILNGASLRIYRGQITVLSGPNGSGKSTLLNYIHAKSMPEIKDPKNRATKLAYLCQNEDSAWNYRVRDFVLLGRYCHTNYSGFYGKKDYMVTDEVMEQVQIGNLKNCFIRELSGGEFQKVRIARCLAQKTDFLLLDEPVANLDFGYQKELLDLMKRLSQEQNMGICATIHDINTAAFYADTLVLLPKLSPSIMGTVDEVLTPENLQKAYGVNVQIYEHPVYKVKQVCL